MKKNLLGFDFCRRFVDGTLSENSSVLPTVDDVDLKEIRQTDSLLAVVFAPSPLTGLPSGDLTYLVNSKANPQIKQFILDNLMLDVSAAARPSVPADVNLSDDDLLALSRQKGESIEDYANRLNTTIERDKWIIQSAVKNDSVKSPEPGVPQE